MGLVYGWGKEYTYILEIMNMVLMMTIVWTGVDAVICHGDVETALHFA
jgi:hypothetical protein